MYSEIKISRCSCYKSFVNQSKAKVVSGGWYHTQCNTNGESGSEPLMEAKDDMLSSFEAVKNLSGAIVILLFSLK